MFNVNEGQRNVMSIEHLCDREESSSAAIERK